MSLYSLVRSISTPSMVSAHCPPSALRFISSLSTHSSSSVWLPVRFHPLSWHPLLLLGTSGHQRCRGPRRCLWNCEDLLLFHRISSLPQSGGPQTSHLGFCHTSVLFQISLFLKLFAMYLGGFPSFCLTFFVPRSLHQELFRTGSQQIEPSQVRTKHNQIACFSHFLASERPSISFTWLLDRTVPARLILV